MKKRMVTLAMAGIMATAMMGTTVMAATQVATSDATISYVNGGIVSGGGNGDILYYITYPSKLQLSDTTQTDSHTISIAAATGYALGGLQVEVEVSSGNGDATMVSGSDKVPYSVAYTNGTVNGTTPTAVTAGTLSDGVSITGNATLGSTTGISNVPKGTTFTDTLEFTFTEQ